VKKIKYNWKRFWCPTTEVIRLDEFGFTYDPDSLFGPGHNPHLTTFEALNHIPCLILLGEPGTGKTQEMNDQAELLKSTIEDTVLIFSLGGQTETILCEKIFENQQLKEWIDGSGKLYLFLDGLDFGLLSIHALTSLLIHKFQKLPLDRLYLRISCRAMVWPNSFEENLKVLWREENYKVYKLAPLRKNDLKEVAQKNNFQANKFLEDIIEKHVVSFAIKPVTLSFLTNLYRKHQQFPSTQTELYTDGCRLLCEEHSSELRETPNFRRPSPDQIMQAAGRIAYITIYTNRSVIWSDIDQGDVPEGNITFREFISVGEINDDLVKEALKSGLFSPLGPHQFIWAHQTYAEFLAAWYCINERMSPTQILSLIVHQNDLEKRIVPQLNETAAWLASMSISVFRGIIHIDPEVLLRSDAFGADPNDKYVLVEALLEQYDIEKIMDDQYDIYFLYRKLNHPGLANQLRPFIVDKSKGFLVRRVAINIAEQCQLQILQKELLPIAFDKSQFHPTRVEAATAISKIGTEEAKALLKQFVISSIEDDPDDQLKGCGLLSAWPDHLTAEELFSSLTQPKRSNLIGIYKHFLLSHPIQHLKIEDLPIALNWVNQLPHNNILDYSFKEIIDDIVIKAWKHLGILVILEKFIQLLLCRLEYYDETITSRELQPIFAQDKTKRQTLLNNLLPIFTDQNNEGLLYSYCFTPLIDTEDIPWLLELILKETNQGHLQVLIKIVKRICNASQLELIFEAKEKNEHLNIEFRSYFETELNSLAAKEQREQFEREKEREKLNNYLIDPPPAQRINDLLDEFEAGNISVWWRINQEMTLKPNSTHYGDPLQADLTKLPGWLSAEHATKKRIIQAAHIHLLEGEPTIEKWLGTTTFYEPAYFAYKAFSLLLQEVEEVFFNLPKNVWGKWMPVIFEYPIWNSQDFTLHRIIVKSAYSHAPDDFIQYLTDSVDQQNAKADNLIVLERIKTCWDDRLAEVLMIKVIDQSLKPSFMKVILDFLIEHQYEAAIAYAKSLLNLPLSEDEISREKAIEAASSLLIYSENPCWDIIWSVFQSNVEFSESLISRIAYTDSILTPNFTDKLTEMQVADLFLWLSKKYPYPNARLETGEAYFVTERHRIIDFRDSLLRQLKNRGTTEACQAIEQLVRELPEFDGLKWTLIEAKKLTRRMSWIPPKATEILALVGNKQKRLVNNGDQLLDIIIESLANLNNELQGNPPSVVDLWDDRGNEIFRPKNENNLSDYVKRYLTKDLIGRGIVINREVEIRRGAETDIKIDAIAKDTNIEDYKIVSVIIETKGSWHRELKEAMQTQLVARYLNECHFGLYLVGWFYCDKWDKEDNRYKQTLKKTMPQISEMLQEQAKNLSTESLTVRSFVLDTSLIN